MSVHEAREHARQALLHPCYRNTGVRISTVAAKQLADDVLVLADEIERLLVAINQVHRDEIGHLLGNNHRHVWGDGWFATEPCIECGALPVKHPLVNP